MSNNKIFQEAFEVISDGQEEISAEKKVIYDKTTGQVSIKIPKSLSLKKSINENSLFEIVFNPSKETLEEAEESGFLIYLKEAKNGKGEKGT